MMKTFPTFDRYQDFTIVKMAGTDEREQAVAREHIDEAGTRSFRAAHSEFFCCDENAQKLSEWLASHGGLPATRWNLEIALRDLEESGQLTAATPPEPESDTGNPSITLTVTDRLLHYVPDDGEAAALSKLADDPSLSDHARKNRDRRLKFLANRQRIQHSDLPAHYGEKVII
jgi:hypothetical protein